MSAIWQNRCTGITARVAGVITASSDAGSSVYVAGSMSAKTAGQADRRGGRGEGEGGYDDFIAWLEARGTQQQDKRIGPAVHRDRVLNSGVRGDCLLELANQFSVGILSPVHDSVDVTGDFRPQLLESRDLREEGYVVESGGLRPGRLLVGHDSHVVFPSVRIDVTRRQQLARRLLNRWRG
jgi:hypothetical protein